MGGDESPSTPKERKLSTYIQDLEHHLLALTGGAESKHQLDNVTCLLLFGELDDAVVGRERLEDGVSIDVAAICQYLLHDEVAVGMFEKTVSAGNDAVEDLRPLGPNAVLDHPLNGSTRVWMPGEILDGRDDFIKYRVDAREVDCAQCFLSVVLRFFGHAKD